MFTWQYMKAAGRSVTPESDVTPGGLISKLFIFFDATDLEEGTYTADIILTHDGPGAVPVIVPTVMIVDSTATAIEDNQTPPAELTLHQNYPNPFNPVTTISFTVPEKSMINLSVYNVEGKLVKTLIDESLDPGLKQRQWDGTGLQGAPVSSGVYFYRLQTGNKVLTKKMVLLK